MISYTTSSGTSAIAFSICSSVAGQVSTCPVLYPLGDDVKLMIDTFANGYSQI